MEVLKEMMEMGPFEKIFPERKNHQKVYHKAGNTRATLSRDFAV